jgi:pimeloyl-ACP methyl ester carboxylesterase
MPPGPDFFLVPGLHGTAGPFERLLRLIPGGAIEIPKSGPQNYGHLAAWLGRQKTPKSFILVGESFGGPLCLRLAATRPRGLKGLVLLGSFAAMDRPLSGLLSHFIPPLPLAANFSRAFVQRALFSGQASPAQLDFFQREAAKTSPWIFRARFQEVMRGDVRPWLPQIQVPVLSLRGSRDRMVPLEAEQTLQGIPRLSRAGIDSPHVIAGTQPQELAKMLLRFRRDL